MKKCHSNLRSKAVSENPDKRNFQWTIGEEYYKFGELEFFGKFTLPVLRKFEAAQKNWRDIIKIPHCHSSFFPTHFPRILATNGEIRRRNLLAKLISETNH